jgi:tetratricopeptide (TPR) repeat protein
MQKSKIALKPFLDKIAGYCDTLSIEDLTDIIIRLAKDVPTSGRVEFLDKIESYLPGRGSAIMPEADPVEQTLNDIEALKESIDERIRSIEDGSYYDDADNWDDDEYYDDDPDYVSEDQVDELGSLFDEAEDLFLYDRLADARKVYGELFKLINAIKEEAYYSPIREIDIREARARYCRCVYETSDVDKRLDEFAEAMEIDESVPENEYNEDYPMMQDVIDARPGEMEDMESFLPAWKRILIERGTKGRPAVLLLETVNRMKGISEVSKLARKWKNHQPQGYLFWLNILKNGNDRQGIITVSREGLEALEYGRFRELVAEFLIDAAEKLNNAKHTLIGKRERFFSHSSDQNLLDLVDEAIKQDLRDQELDTVIDFFKTRKTIDDDKKALYVKTLLMSGKLSNAFAMTKKAKSVGWSHRSNAGIVFGSVLSVLAGHSEKAGTIRTLLKGYANKRSVYSERFSTDDVMGASFYEEIIKGLRQEKETKSEAAEYLSWAEKIGKSRIEHIVSNKHRGAYDRAAQALGSIAETYAAMGQTRKAVNILHKYYSEKYNRFSAFRREVKSVVMDSVLLKNSGFLA